MKIEEVVKQIRAKRGNISVLVSAEQWFYDNGTGSGLVTVWVSDERRFYKGSNFQSIVDEINNPVTEVKEVIEQVEGMTNGN